MKKRIYTVFLIVIVMMLITCIMYECVFKPFIGYDEDFIETYQYNDKLNKKNYIKSFYIDFLNYKKYEQYNTNYKYSYGKKSLTYGFSSYVYESGSYIIYLKNDYQSIKSKLLTELEFEKIPTECGDLLESVVVDDFIYYEIARYNIIDDFYDANYMCDPSFWFAYNDVEQTILFGYMYDCSLDYYESEEDLIKIIKKNLAS